jgi:hypothetical protein
MVSEFSLRFANLQIIWEKQREFEGLTPLVKNLEKGSKERWSVAGGDHKI